MSADPGRTSARLFFREAINQAIGEEMRRDPKLVLMGQDIGAFGGAYKEFGGLFDEFGPERVRDTPVAEAAMVGLGVGLAAAGMRALVSITYMDFLMLALDPLVNYAAKARFKTAGRITVPIVVKTTAGAKGQGVAHSQCLEAWLLNIPGLKVVAPSTPGDAYGLLRSALRSDGPVVFVDHKRLFPLSGDVGLADPPIAFGRAAIRRMGEHVTIATYGYMVRVALEAAVRLAEQDNVSCEVVDLRSLAPLDIETLVASAARTSALVTLEEGQVACGVGAEIAFRVREQLPSIAATRVGAAPAPVSSSPWLERACVPDADRVVEAVRNLLDTDRTEGLL